MFFRRFPIATVGLGVLIIIAYWLLAADTPYITEENLDEFALTKDNPLSIFTHQFIHVGIFHLIGNLLPLLFFGLALEATLGSFDVFLIFIISGSFSSLLFALINPGVSLIGASAGISGLVSAILLTRPKTALVLLIATPLLISFVFYPAADFASKFYEENLAEKKVVVEKKLEIAVQQNESPGIIEGLNQTLQKTEEEIDTTFEGKQREAETPTDFWVHIYGAILGAAYIYVMKRKKLQEAEREFVDIGREIFEWLDKLTGRWKKR